MLANTNVITEHFSNSLESRSNQEKQFFQRPLRLPSGPTVVRVICLCVCVAKRTLFNTLQKRKASSLCSHVLAIYWSCLRCLADESGCVAKSHSEWPPCPRPGQTCHRCNGYHISAPLFMHSNGALISIPVPPLFYSLHLKWLCNWSY